MPNSIDTNPFPTIHLLANECKADWEYFQKCANQTHKLESRLKDSLTKIHERLLDADSSLILFGSMARYEAVQGSDCDWTLLVDGVANLKHTEIARDIHHAIQADEAKGLCSPGPSGVFGNLCFSHNLVHSIGGNADTNENMTRRLLMFLESKPISITGDDSSVSVWETVTKNILSRYFEEDVHFSTAPSVHQVPRFLFNDLTRYWRTICVDYAAKHWNQGEMKWAMRNAKIRFSRKLLYAAGMAFCYTCHLDDSVGTESEILPGLEIKDITPKPYVELALEFARTPPLEYLASFIHTFVSDEERRRNISEKIFGSYNQWLRIISDTDHRKTLTDLSHEAAKDNELFNDSIRPTSKEFSSGLKWLFFNKDTDPDNPISNLSLEYVGF